MFTLVALEFKKLKRSRIIHVSLVTVLLFFICASIQGIKSNYSAEKLMNDTLSYSTFMLLPAILTLIGSYSISREDQEDTWKNMSIIPIKYHILISAKLISSLIISIVLSISLFGFTLISQMAVHFNQVTTALIFIYLKSYFLQGIGCFIASAPIISSMALFKNGHWLSVILAEIYSFAGIFAASSPFRSIYPVSAVFGFSGAGALSLPEYMVCCLSLLACIMISWYILMVKKQH